jgi:hypothetical protein
MRSKQKLKKAKLPLWKRILTWIRSNKRISTGITTLVTILGLSLSYINTGSDSLRADVYQPLYTEINVMDNAIRANNLASNYSSANFETMTKNGNLLRIPKSLRAKISRLYRLCSEQHSHILPLTMRIAWMMPPEIRVIREQADDTDWAAKAVMELNSQIKTPAQVYGISFTMSHTGRGPAIRTADSHISSPGTIDWEINDWMRFPQSATDINSSWTNTWFLGFNSRSESWDNRITRDDLSKAHKSLEAFLQPTYNNLSDDHEFQELLRNNNEAIALMQEVKVLISDRMSQPKHIFDLIDF